MQGLKLNTTEVRSDGKWLIQGPSVTNVLLKLMLYMGDVKMD